MNRKKFYVQPSLEIEKNVSTTDALLYATEKIRNEIKNANIEAGAFIDLSKAFDSLSHSCLLDKTKHMGFSIQANNILKSYLTGRIQKVKFLAIPI